MNAPYLPNDIMDLILFERRASMAKDKAKNIFNKLISNEEIEEGSGEYWINWNYAKGCNWGGGFDEVGDDDYDNPIWAYHNI